MTANVGIKVNLGDYIHESKERILDKDVPVLSVTNSGGFKSQGDYFSKTVHSTNISKYKYVKRGQFAYNPSRINVGSIDLLTAYDEGALSPMYVVFDTDQHRLMPKYLNYFRQSHEFKSMVRQNTAGSVRESLSFDGLSRFEMYLPPVPSQQKICDLLSRLDKLITESDSVISKLIQLKKAIAVECFTTVDTTSVTLKDSGIIIIDGDRGSNYPKQKDLLSEGYCVFLNTPNIDFGDFNFQSMNFITSERDNLLRKGRLQRNDIVLTTRGTVGKLAWYNDQVPYDNIRINSGMVILRAPSEWNTSFLLQQFLSPYVQNQMKDISSGSAQPQLPIGTLHMLKLAKPSLVEQQRIAVLLSAIDQKINTSKQLNKVHRRLKLALMQDLLGGKVLV